MFSKTCRETRVIRHSFTVAPARSILDRTLEIVDKLLRKPVQVVEKKPTKLTA